MFREDVPAGFDELANIPQNDNDSRWVFHRLQDDAGAMRCESQKTVSCSKSGDVLAVAEDEADLVCLSRSGDLYGGFDEEVAQFMSELIICDASEFPEIPPSRLLQRRTA